MLLVIVLMVLLLAANYWVGRSLLYPPAMFVLVWTGGLVLLATTGSLFYHVGMDTLLFYVWGVCVFSLGGAIAWFWPFSSPKSSNMPHAERSQGREYAIQRLLNGLLVLLLLGFPVYVYRLLRLVSDSTVQSFLWAVQLQLREYKSGEGASEISFFDNFAVLSILVAIVCHKESDGSWRRKLRATLAVVLSMGYNLLRGERAATMTLLIALVGISWLRARAIKWKQLVLVGALFVFAFSLVGIALQKGYINRDAPLSENLKPLVESFQWYAAGGLAAFDHVFHDPQRIPAVWKWNRVFLQAANKLGGSYYVPDLNAEFVDVGPETYTNVYTMYFAYFPEFGLVGTSLIVVMLGWVVTLTYLAAERGGHQAQVLFSILLGSILLSGFNEQFFMALNFLAKALLFTFVVYKWGRLEKLPGLALARSARRLAWEGSWGGAHQGQG